MIHTKLTRRREFGRMMRDALLCLGVALSPLSAASASAAGFPERQVTIVVPYGPGGAVGNFGLMLADNLSREWGQPVIVENRPGAGASIGSALVAESEPDGYTILLASDAAFVANEFIFKDMGYNPREDFIPVSHLANVNYALFVSKRLGITDFGSFVKTMREKGGDFSYGSTGGGDPSRLGMETLKREAELGDIVEIPYTGMSNTVQGLVSGDHDMMMVSVRTIQPHIDSGDVIPLIISGEARAESLPDVPTFAEEGYPDMQVRFFLAAAVPDGTDPQVVEEISRALAKIMKIPSVRETYVDKLGYELVGSTPEEARKVINSEREHVAKTVEILGIEPQ